MSDTSTNITPIEAIADQAQDGKDISEHFTGQFQAKQRLDLALPFDLLKSIDAECERHSITRQDWIVAACADKLREIQVNVMSKAS